MDRRPRIDRTHWSRTGVIRTIAKSQRENVIAAQKRFRETAEGHLRPRFENEDLRRWFGKKPEGEWEDIADRYRPGVETNEGWWPFGAYQIGRASCRERV